MVGRLIVHSIVIKQFHQRTNVYQAPGKYLKVIKNDKCIYRLNEIPFRFYIREVNHTLLKIQKILSL